MIDDVVEGVFESAGEDLTREGDGKQFELVVVVVLVSGHPILRILSKGCWIIYSNADAGFLGVNGLFLQAQRKSKGLRAFAQSPLTAGLCVFSKLQPYTRPLRLRFIVTQVNMGTVFRRCHLKK